MNKKRKTNPDFFLSIFISYVCLLLFLLSQAIVFLRMILELLELVPGAFYGMTGVLLVFSATACLLVKVLQGISRLIDGTVEADIWKQRMIVGCVVCFGIIYPAALGFRDGMSALFYYKAVNLQILLPWMVVSVIAVVQNRLEQHSLIR